MQVSGIPTKFPVAFAASAGPTYVRPVPVTTANPAAASFTLGFPPITFLPLGAGGSPPDGRDFNGILNEITLWNQWQQAGAPVFYDAAFSAAIGGYPKGAIIAAATVGNYWFSTVDDNVTNPDAGGAGWTGFSPVLGNVFPELFGAIADCQTAQAIFSIGSGTPNLTSTSALFSATDVGKSIVVPGAGAGAALITTILGYVSPNAVTLAANAATTLSGSAETISWGTDSTTALLAWATFLQSSGRIGQLSPGIYVTTQTIDFGQMSTVIGTGVEWQGSGSGGYAATGYSMIRSHGANILMAKNGYYLSNFVLDGFGIALWGYLSPANQARQSTDSMAVIHCAEYGFVLNQSQNASHLNLSCRHNKYNIVFANGARNNNLYNFGSSTESDSILAGSADDRCILFLIDTSNPHGFGLATSVTLLGNDRNAFFGGISENYASADFVFESKNLSGYGGTTCGAVHFFSYEMDGSQIFKLDSTWTGDISAYDCSFSWSNSFPMTNGAYGSIEFYGNFYLQGAYGLNLSQFGIASGTNFYQKMAFRLTDDVSPPYELSGGGPGTVSYNAAARQFSVTAGPGPFGVGGVQLPNDILNLNNQRLSFVAAVKPIYRITFTVGSVVGGSGKINLYADVNGSPYRTLIGAYAAGTYEVLYQTVGNEQGTISFTYNDVTSFKVSGITLEYL